MSCKLDIHHVGLSTWLIQAQVPSSSFMHASPDSMWYDRTSSTGMMVFMGNRMSCEQVTRGVGVLVDKADWYIIVRAR